MCSACRTPGRNRPRDAGAHLRSLLHDQGRQRRHRARTGHGVRLRQGIARRRRSDVHAWRRHDHHDAAARSRRRASGRAGIVPRAGERVAMPPANGCWWWRTEPMSAPAWRESCRITASTSARRATATAPCACCLTERAFALMCIDGVMPGLETATVIERARELPIDAGAGLLGPRAGGVAAPRHRHRPLRVPVEALLGATAARQRQRRCCARDSDSPDSMLLREIRYAVRSLWHSKGFALVGILCLGLGIGLNTTIFSIVDGVLLQPYPYDDPDRIVVLEHAQNRRTATRPACRSPTCATGRPRRPRSRRSRASRSGR